MAIFLIAASCCACAQSEPPRPRAGSPIAPPRVLSQPDPAYPKEARKKKVEGTVVLWVTVGTDGLVHAMSVKQSVGYGLDEAAMKAVRKWKFQPAMKDGQPVEARIDIAINFRLN